MRDRNVIIKYLKIEKIDFDIDKQYILSNDDTIEEYYKSLNWLIEISQHVYYKQGIMLHVFNDYLMTFNFSFDNFKSIYDYALNINHHEALYFISDFILSFQFSLESHKYKKMEDYEKLSANFYACFERRQFYGSGNILIQAMKYNIDLYNHLNDDIYLNNLRDIERIFPKLFERARHHLLYKQLFDTYFTNYKNSLSLIDYDYNHNIHTEIYNQFLVNELNQNFLMFDKIQKIIRKYSNYNVLTESNYILIINSVIKQINNVIELVKTHNKDEIRMVSLVEDIIKTLSTMKKCTIFYNEYKNKVEECIRTILYVKRNFLKMNESDILPTEFEFTIPTKEIENINEIIAAGFQNLYQLLKIDFDAELENAIVSHSEHPIIDLVSHVSINSELGLYSDDDLSINNKFSEYFNSLGKEIIERKSEELTNIYSNDYYVLLLRRLNMTRSVGAQIFLMYNRTLFNNSFIKFIKDNIIGNESKVFDNIYVLCSRLILINEQLVYEIMKSVNLEKEFKKGKMENNLEILFMYFKDDSFSRNAIMYNEYHLYCERGANLRNDFMHGNAFHKDDLMVSLIYVFACTMSLIMIRSKYEY